MNYYEILGVGPGATDQQIKEAYRREAMKWHPDRHEGEAAKGEADRRFKDLAVAYRTLRSSVDRANYDRQIEQKLRQEYESRQKEQARQQRAQNEQAQQKQTRQEPPQQDFEDTGPQFEEQSTSNDEANQMFYEQMLDLAAELAGRGFPEFNIVKALVALGCPEALAKSVSVAAMSRTSQMHDSKHHSAETDSDLRGTVFWEAGWETLEPYYKAAVEGKNVHPPLSEGRRKIAIAQIARRKKIWLAIAALVLLVGAAIGFSSKSPEDKWSTFFIAFALQFYILFFYLISLRTFLKPETKQYVSEESVAHYLRVFEAFHRAKFEGVSVPSRSFQLFGFNFTAFAFNYGWLLYRKVYGAAFLFVIAYVVAYVVTAISSEKFYPDAQIWIPLCLSFFIGVFGNRLYFNKVRKLFQAGDDGEAQTAVLKRLRKNGGTSSVLVWLVPVFLIFMLAGIAVPAYQDYTRRAKVATAFAVGSGAAQKVGDYFVATKQGPSDLKEAGFSFVPSQTVKDVAFNGRTGVLTISLQDAFFSEKSLLLVPRVVNGSVTWLCTSNGISNQHLPQNCRATQNDADAELAAIEKTSESEKNAKDEYARKLGEVEARYPQLNPDSPLFNPAALKWVVDRKRIYEEGGRSPVESLQLVITDYAIELDMNRRPQSANQVQQVRAYDSSTYFGGVGKQVSLNFQNIEIRSLLQIFSDFSGHRFIADEQVNGRVNILANDQPWTQSLVQLLNQNRLAVIKVSGSYYVFHSSLSDEEALRRANRFVSNTNSVQPGSSVRSPGGGISQQEASETLCKTWPSACR